MVYKTYIDESGNTGSNLSDQNQKFFTLAAVSVPSDREVEIQDFIQAKFDSIKEIGETEIKAARWVKTPKRAAILQSTLEYMKSANCDFSLVVIEKRLMVCAFIVDNYLDGAYNDFEDLTWVNDKEEKKIAAQYFYDILTDDDVELIARAFTKPEHDLYIQAYELVFAKTFQPDYRRMLAGCHIEELFQDDYDAVMNNQQASPSAFRSANYTAFTALGMRVASFCRRKGYTTNIVFDSCLLCNDAYSHLFDMFKRMQANDLLEAWAGIITWKGFVDNFTVANSKSSFVLQTADIVATSVLKTIEKIANGSTLSDYDKYIVSFISFLCNTDGFHFVISNEIIQKLKKALADG